jgi:hypothetical protein
MEPPVVDTPPPGGGLSLDTVVRVDVAPWAGGATRRRRVRLRRAFALGATAGPALHELARHIVGVDAHELLTDDNPTTGAVTHAVRQLTALRRRWLAGE